jgi:hypothetical protein
MDATRRYAKVVVTLEPREDGGLRAYSDDVPGFVLSHRDPEKVLADIKPALEAILSDMWNATVHTDVLLTIRDPEDLYERRVIDPCTPQKVEYVAEFA